MSEPPFPCPVCRGEGFIASHRAVCRFWLRCDGGYVYQVEWPDGRFKFAKTAEEAAEILKADKAKKKVNS